MDQNKVRIGGKFRTILILMALVVIGMGSTTLISKSVTLVYDGQEISYNTTASTVGEFLAEKEIEIVENIYLEPAVDTAISNDLDITVRSPREIIILDNGVETTVESGEILVEDILIQHGYELKEKDYAIPTLDTEINFEDESEPLIIINRVLDKTVTDVVSVPFETVTQENAELEKGKSRVVTPGIEGTTVITTETTVLNGEEVSSKVSEEVVKAPINQVNEVGTKEPPKPAATKVGGGGSLNGRNYSRVITMQATAYDASPASNGQWAGVTALGTKLRPGVVAVDRSVIPLGSRLYIESTDGWPSYGIAVAEDVGGAIKGNKIDLFFESASTVKSFGRRNVKVYVLD